MSIRFYVAFRVEMEGECSNPPTVTVMHQALQALLLLVLGGGAVTALARAAVYWFEPARRVERRLRKVLGGPPDAIVVGPATGQGVALRVDEGRIAIMRGIHDAGLVFELHELVGAELIFDGHVAARAFRGEQRRPLDRIDPEVSRVTLRLVFDDVRDPDFEMEVWSLGHIPRPGWDGPTAVQSARKFFARAEALVRR